MMAFWTVVGSQRTPKRTMQTQAWNGTLNLLSVTSSILSNFEIWLTVFTIFDNN